MEGSAAGRPEQKRTTGRPWSSVWNHGPVAYVVPPALALVIAGVVWEAWVRIGNVAEYIVPAPTAIFSDLFGDIGQFALHGGVTLGEALAGFALGASVAIVGAVVMSQSRLLERSLLPLAVLVKVTPIVAVAPLFVIWFGFGSFPKILIASLITFFPVLVNALAGLRSASPEALDLFRSLNASNAEVLWKLRAPGSLPYLFAAFRISVPLSVIGAVVGEWFTGDRGLGSVIIVAHNNLDMPRLFAAVAVLAFIGISLTALTWYAEKRALFWHESERGF
jgi:NitT/TauT family transport system permease protein